jgi:hypothetical protein
MKLIVTFPQLCQFGANRRLAAAQHLCDRLFHAQQISKKNNLNMQKFAHAFFLSRLAAYSLLFFQQIWFGFSLFWFTHDALKEMLTMRKNDLSQLPLAWLYQDLLWVQSLYIEDGRWIQPPSIKSYRFGRMVAVFFIILVAVFLYYSSVELVFSWLITLVCLSAILVSQLADDFMKFANLIVARCFGIGQATCSFMIVFFGAVLRLLYGVGSELLMQGWSCYWFGFGGYLAFYGLVQQALPGWLMILLPGLAVNPLAMGVWGLALSFFVSIFMYSNQWFELSIISHRALYQEDIVLENPLLEIQQQLPWYYLQQSGVILLALLCLGGYLWSVPSMILGIKAMLGGYRAFSTIQQSVWILPLLLVGIVVPVFCYGVGTLQNNLIDQLVQRLENKSGLKPCKAVLCNTTFATDCSIDCSWQVSPLSTDQVLKQPDSSVSSTVPSEDKACTQPVILNASQDSGRLTSYFS